MDEQAKRLVRQLRDAHRAFGEAIEELASVLGRSVPDVSDGSGFYRMGRLLAMVAQRGGTVSSHQLYAIGDELGYDRRGLGGFFRGEFPSLEVETTYGGRRLTSTGRLKAERWRSRYGRVGAKP